MPPDFDEELIQVLSDLMEAGHDDPFAAAKDTHPEESARIDALRESLAETARDEIACAMEQPRFHGGDRIGGYEVVEHVGSGGMGDVYRARRRNVEVAVKVLRDPVLRSPERRAEVFDVLDEERAILTRMQHPGIVPVLDGARSEDPVPFLVMRFVSGVTLRDHVRSRVALEPRAAAALTASIADAIAHAHVTRVLHCDVNPNNVLIDDQTGASQVVDFGIARVLGAADPEGYPATPLYMAPEQAAREAPTERTDVHGLGATLFFSLTGRAPFEAEFRSLDYDAYRAFVARADAPSVDDVATRVPTDLDAICRHALSRDPSRRYRGAAELRDDLNRFLAHQPVVARPIGPLARLGRLVRRRPRTTVAVLMGALLVTAVVAFFFQRERSARARIAYRAAISAAEHGDWPAALERYAEARSAGHPDHAAITIGEIEAWEGSREPERARDALRRLLAAPGRHRATALLLKADLDVDRVADPEAGLELVREALQLDATAEDDRERLGPGDRAFARSLLAIDVDDALDVVRAGLAEEPFHRRLNETLVTLLLASGRLDEFDRHAHAMARMFPSDLTSAVTSAVADGLRGRSSEHRGDAEEELARWTAFGTDLGRVLRSVAAALAQSDEPGLAVFANLLALPGFARKYSDVLSSDRLGQMRMPPSVVRPIRSVATSLPLALTNPSEAASRLESAGRALGEGTFIWFAAGFAVLVDELERAERLMLEAIEMRHTFVPVANVRARLLAVQMVRFQAQPNARDELLARLRRTMSDLRVDDLELDMHFHAFCFGALATDDSRHARASFAWVDRHPGSAPARLHRVIAWARSGDTEAAAAALRSIDPGHATHSLMQLAQSELAAAVKARADGK